MIYEGYGLDIWGHPDHAYWEGRCATCKHFYSFQDMYEDELEDAECGECEKWGDCTDIEKGCDLWESLS